jgi:hypothetical protein
VESRVREAYEDIRRDADQLLFLSWLFREAGIQVPLVTMSCPSLRTAAPPPCLPLGIKVLLKEDGRLLDEGGFWVKGGFWMKGGFLMKEGFLMGKAN